MATASGSSAVGFQRLTDRIDASSSLVRLLLSPQADGAPDRVGFYYVIVSTDGGFQKYVVDTGPLYIPGLMYAVPERFLLVGKNINLWVNWDVGGIPWSYES